MIETFWTITITLSARLPGVVTSRMPITIPWGISAAVVRSETIGIASLAVCPAMVKFVTKVYVIDDDWRVNYTWNDGFGDLKFEDDDDSSVNIPSDWDDYSHEESLYDALGGEMDAVWNID